MSEFINPFTDIGFKRIFGNDDVRAYRDTNIVMEGQYQEGEKKGELNKAKDIAKKLKAMNLDFEKIADATGLTKEEIDNL